MEHLHVFTTGGSIDKGYSTHASDFVVGAPQIADILREANVGFAYSIDVLMQKDSLAINDEDRALIVARVSASPHAHILITHGTDTMAQTGVALLQARLPKTIVLTGAMQPHAFKVSDAAFNVGLAVAGVQALPTGVYVAMSGALIPADKARKDHARNRFVWG